jgi:hypothetical protein
MLFVPAREKQFPIIHQTAASRPGEGAMFSVRIPLARRGSAG